jgi:hypothetical protein
MSDLVLEFFERDFTDAEKDSLGVALKASEKEAMRFMDRAAEAYAKTGLPEPKAPHVRLPRGGGGQAAKSAGGKPSRLNIPWGGIQAFLTLLFVVVVALIAWKGPDILGEKVESPALLLPDEADAPVAVKKAVAARKAPVPVILQRYVRGRTYRGLLAVVNKPTDGATKVRVVDSMDRVVRNLFDGVIGKGAWVFQWDGRQENGRMSPNGNYSIEVESNGRVLRQPVRVGTPAPPEPVSQP